MSNLKEAIEEYDILQKKCMKQFAGLKSSISGCGSLDILREKFVKLNEKGIAFVSERLINPNITMEHAHSMPQDFKQNVLWNWINSDATDKKYVSVQILNLVIG